MNDLAKVGDRIEHGQDIPDNVVVLRDAEGDDRMASTVRLYVRDGDGEEGWWPMTVVEVDPEPQPAGPKPLVERVADDVAVLRRIIKAIDASSGALDRLDRIASITQELQARLDTVKSDRETVKASLELVKQRIREQQPAESGPLVLTLPVVPDGATLVGNKTGARYTPPTNGPQDGSWYNTATFTWHDDISTVLQREHPDGVTVEMAPPREPRVWPKLDTLDPADDDPEIVDVDGHGRWTWDNGRGLYTDGIGSWQSLGELQHMGEVREVLT